MTTLPYRPWSGLANFDNNFNQWLKFPSIQSATYRGWRPALDIQETKESFVLTMDVPGLRSENIDLSLDDNLLVIKGKRELRSEQASDDGAYKRIERISGEFLRNVELPTHITFDDISAGVQDGVLTITVSKPVVEQPRKITVN